MSCEEAFGDGKKYLENNECVEHCSKDAYVQIGTNICGGNCASGFYKIDDNTNVCIEEADCGSSTFRIGVLKECVGECDSNEYRKADGTKTYCYTDACPEGTYVKSNSEKECVSTCDSGFY